MLKNLKEDKGFTLIEILMAMIIIGILTQMSILYLIDIRKRAYDAMAITDGKNLMTSVGSSFTLLDDVDFTHFPGDGSEVGTTRFSDGGGREAIFKLSPGVKAEITGQSDKVPGNGFVTAYLFHENGSDDPGSFTGSGRKEFYFMIDELTSAISVPE